MENQSFFSEKSVRPGWDDFWYFSWGSLTVHLLIFFWVGFRWDGHYGPEMGGMDPTCRHPKPRPTNPRNFLTHHYFRTEMESSKSPRILIQRCFQKLCPEPFLELERKGKL